MARKTKRVVITDEDTIRKLGYLSLVEEGHDMAGIAQKAIDKYWEENSDRVKRELNRLSPIGDYNEDNED